MHMATVLCMSMSLLLAERNYAKKTVRVCELDTCMPAFRDDVMAQNRRHLRQRAKQPDELDRSLQHIAGVIAEHLDVAMNHIRELAGSSAGSIVDGSSSDDTANAVNKARSLMTAATDPEQLCAQDPTFHPWF
jgi:predicted ATP-dependent protease